MIIKAKIWVEDNKKQIFGPGKLKLLKAIDEYGSINKAAHELKIPYRRAWGYINDMETALSFPIVIKEIGGKHGGGTKLTKNILNLIEIYEELNEEVIAFASKKSDKILDLMKNIELNYDK